MSHRPPSPTPGYVDLLSHTGHSSWSVPRTRGSRVLGLYLNGRLGLTGRVTTDDVPHPCRLPERTADRVRVRRRRGLLEPVPRSPLPGVSERTPGTQVTRRPEGEKGGPTLFRRDFRQTYLDVELKPRRYTRLESET